MWVAKSHHRGPGSRRCDRRSPGPLAIAGLVAASFAGSPRETSAELLISPAVVEKELAPGKASVDSIVATEIGNAATPLRATTSVIAQALEACANTIACLARVGRAENTTHVLHVALARRQANAVVQLTLIESQTGKVVEKARATAEISLTGIEAAATSASQKLVERLRSLPGLEPAMKPQVAATEPARTSSPPDALAPPETSRPKTPPEAIDPEAIAPRSFAAPDTGAEVVAQTVQADADRPLSASPNYLAYGVAGAGAASGVAGLVTYFMGVADLNRLADTPQVFVTERADLLDSGTVKRSLGVGLVIGGGAALLAASILYLTDVGVSK